MIPIDSDSPTGRAVFVVSIVVVAVFFLRDIDHLTKPSGRYFYPTSSTQSIVYVDPAITSTTVLGCGEGGDYAQGCGGDCGKLGYPNRVCGGGPGYCQCVTTTTVQTTTTTVSEGSCRRMFLPSGAVMCVGGDDCKEDEDCLLTDVLDAEGKPVDIVCKCRKPDDKEDCLLIQKGTCAGEDDCKEGETCTLRADGTACECNKPENAKGCYYLLTGDFSGCTGNCPKEDEKCVRIEGGGCGCVKRERESCKRQGFSDKGEPLCGGWCPTGKYCVKNDPVDPSSDPTDCSCRELSTQSIIDVVV